MAEYYPLLSKAVGSLPNSSPETRRIVYERARKALIGQLRTLHPPVPDEEIEKESVALDQAIERVEAELAAGASAAPPTPSTSPVSPPAAPPAPPVAASPPAAPPAKPTLPVRPPPLPRLGDGIPVAADKRPLAPLRPRPPIAKAPSLPDAPPPVEAEVVPLESPAAAVSDGEAPQATADADGPPGADDSRRLKPPQRPIAPQPAGARSPKRRLWIVPVALALIVAGVGFAAWKLRDHPEAIVQNKPTEPSQSDSGKIAERVGNPQAQEGTPTETPAPAASQPAQPAQEAAPQPAPAPEAAPQQGTPAAKNPELPVAHRAALLVEAPSEPNKVKTYLGTVVWKLNNVPQGQNDTVGVAVEADIDLPDDKLKAVVTFAKNTEASLPASHTINVKFIPETGSATGDVKQISVPQMRPESSPGGEPLAGVTVQIVPNSFLVGLSPGNAEAANTELIRRLQWVDIPMLLDSGKIAKLTFEKSDSGQRDLAEALNAWQKQ